MSGYGIVFWIVNSIIVLFGLLVFAQMNSAHKRIRDNKDEARRVYETVRGKPVVNIASGIMGESVETAFEPDRMDHFREKYNSNSTKYFAWVQWISLFPLMGLLGTVVGLIPGLNAVSEGDFQTLYSSLSTALWSTLIGLICSILLKILASVYSKTISDIEDYFEECDRKYNMALNLNRVRKEME